MQHDLEDGGIPVRTKVGLGILEEAFFFLVARPATIQGDFVEKGPATRTIG